MWIPCLAEDSHEIWSLIFSEKQWKSICAAAAVVIGALRVNFLIDKKTTEKPSPEIMALLIKELFPL